MKTFFFHRQFSLVALLFFGFALPANAQAVAENGAPANAAQVGGVEETARDSDVTILPETAAGATILPDVETQLTPQERRARLAEKRRQSEEKLLDLLREVGGDVPQLRQSLRDFLTDEAQARKPMRAQGNRLLSALRIGVANAKITAPEEAMLKLHEALRQEMPFEKNQNAAPEENQAPGAGTIDSELRISLRQQKPAANAASTNAPDDETRRDSLRVLAQHDNDQLRALVATMRQMQTDERAKRAQREAELDAKLHFRDNPRLEAALLLLGIIGDSGYTVSIKMLPAPTASTRVAPDKTPPR